MIYDVFVLFRSHSNEKVRPSNLCPEIVALLVRLLPCLVLARESHLVEILAEDKNQSDCKHTFSPKMYVTIDVV